MKERKKIDVGTLWWALFLFKQLDRNGSISLKCMACNHFVALSVRCCAIITELARYNKKNGHGYPVVDDVFAVLLWNN